MEGERKYGNSYIEREGLPSVAMDGLLPSVMSELSWKIWWASPHGLV